MSTLKILFPQPEVVAVGARKVSIRPVELRHFELFGQAASDLMRVISTASMDQLHAYGQQSSAQLAKVIANTTSMSHWRARRLPVPVAIQLMLQIIQVNASFFVEAQVAAASQLDGLQSQSA